MNVSFQWLSEYIEHQFSPEELAVALTSLGIEVEAIDDRSKRYDKIVVGEVLEVTDHPNADSLHLTKVSIGSDPLLRIVCGAPNVRAGMKVAVAQIGADLGEGFVIKKSKIRGEASEGMLCSAKELGLSDDHSGLLELPKEATIGTPLSEVLGLTDTILEIGITPNRADCLSHIGIAREVAIASKGSVKKPTIDRRFLDSSRATTTDAVRVDISAPDLCPRYVARVVKGVTVKESPEWLKKKLEAVGLRPRNNIVDVTNFVLMECGHPLHAFDLSTVNDAHIVVRTAKGFAEKFVTLDNKERVLPPDTLLIADPEKPLAIAGIMGGANSEITERTTTVLIESAYFDPRSIRRSSKLLGLSTDASYRFERGVDMENVIFAADRAAALMAELAGGEVLKGLIDEYPAPIKTKSFSFRPMRANTLLSTSIESKTMSTILHAVGFSIDDKLSGEWQLQVPSWRVDLDQEVDAIEEIARVIGYDNLPTSTEDRIPMKRERNVLPKRSFDSLLRNTLVDLGFSECISTPMYSAAIASAFHEQPVELMNPLTSELERMRTSIAGNLLEVARRNERFAAPGQRLFEMGAVFHYSSSHETVAGIAQPWELSLLLKDHLEEKSPYNTKEPVADLFSMRGTIELLTKRLGIDAISFVPLSEAKSLGDWKLATEYLSASESLAILHKRDVVGIIGKASASLTTLFDLRTAPYIATLSYDKLHSIVLQIRTKERSVRALPKFPAVERDIALIVDKAITARKLLDEVRAKVPAELVEDMRIFDSFESKEMKAQSKKSLGVRISLRSQQRTLEDAEVDAIIEQVITSLREKTGATLRG